MAFDKAAWLGTSVGTVLYDWDAIVVGRFTPVGQLVGMGFVVLPDGGRNH